MTKKLLKIGRNRTEGVKERERERKKLKAIVWVVYFLEKPFKFYNVNINKTPLGIEENGKKNIEKKVLSPLK